MIPPSARVDGAIGRLVDRPLHERIVGCRRRHVINPGIDEAHGASDAGDHASKDCQQDFHVDLRPSELPPRRHLAWAFKKTPARMRFRLRMTLATRVRPRAAWTSASESTYPRGVGTLAAAPALEDLGRQSVKGLRSEKCADASPQPWTVGMDGSLHRRRGSIHRARSAKLRCKYFPSLTGSAGEPISFFQSMRSRCPCFTQLPDVRQATESGGRMTSSAPASRLGPEFEDFLFAPIGADENGMLVSVLSALARLDLDPWREAAKLAGLPRETAVQRLTSLIGALPEGTWARQDLRAIADRLTALLPRRVRNDVPARETSIGAGPAVNSRAAIVFMIFMVLMLGAQSILAGRQPPAQPNGADAPASSAVPVPTPRSNNTNG